MASITYLESQEELMEAIEAKRLMAEWGLLDDLPGDDEDKDEKEVEARDLQPGKIYYDEDDGPLRDVSADTDFTLDHIILGCSDMDFACQQFTAMTGVKPAMIHTQYGLGTKCARVSFSETCFLEIMGPDPSACGSLSATLAEIEPGVMVPLHYAVRNSKTLEMLQKDWPKMGYECDSVTIHGIDKMGLWKWELCILGDHGDGGIVPFFIDWGESEHACTKLPVVGDIENVTVRVPSGNLVHNLLEGVGGVSIEEGDPLLRFTFSSQNGTHTFSSVSPKGISYPECEN